VFQHSEFPGQLGPAVFRGLWNRLAAQIFGQAAAIEEAVSALERRYRLPEPDGRKRPIWNAVFAGSSGVGKTMMARLIGEDFFGSDSVCCIDCSELTQEHHAARLVGAPPGYVGYDRPGQLVAGLERRSSGVLVFDELEKAHPQIVTSVLLPLLGNGVVHDMSTGRQIDASQWVVVMTSNLGAQLPSDRAVGFRHAEDKPEKYHEVIRTAIDEHFPREFLGRVDDVVVFQRLGQDAVLRIWDGEVTALEGRLRRQGEPVRVEITPEATAVLLNHATTGVEGQGARCVVRCFNQAIADRCIALLDEPVAAPSVLRVELVDRSLRYRLLPEEDAC
jgi:ATP-dependent Clp protease ATP-binding subunit ClpA